MTPDWARAGAWIARAMRRRGPAGDAASSAPRGDGLSPKQALRLALLLESCEDAIREEEEEEGVPDEVGWDELHGLLMGLAGEVQLLELSRFGDVVVRVAREDVELHRAKWAQIAKENGWHEEPFGLQLWIWPDDGSIRDSVSFRGLREDVFVNEVTDQPFAPGALEVV